MLYWPSRVRTHNIGGDRHWLQLVGNPATMRSRRPLNGARYKFHWHMICVVLSHTCQHTFLCRFPCMFLKTHVLVSVPVHVSDNTRSCVGSRACFWHSDCWKQRKRLSNCSDCWVSDYCLTTNKQIFSYIMARTSYFSIRWWWW